MALTGKSPAGTYKDLITLENSNNGVDGTLRNIRTGNGSNTSASISDRALKIKSATDNTTALDIQNSSGASKFVVDTTNSQVKSLGTHINTQYARFGIGASSSSNYVVDTHHPLPFTSIIIGSTSLQDNLKFGTGTDPATTFTTADGSDTDASLLVPVLWYVPDSISIDSVYHIEGGTASTGDTTRLHLFSYTFTSGSTSALTSGTLLAHSNDITNAGSEQAYSGTWTVDSASVTAGKVILAFFVCDSVNSNYSVNLTVKYHLT